MRRHENDKRYACDKCDKKFVRKDGLDDHYAKHTNERKFACHCGKTFKYRKSLKRHRDAKICIKQEKKEEEEEQMADD